MSTLAVGTIKSISSATPVFQNTSGTEKGQLVKAWVNFNGTGTVAIRDSFNVSSITDVATGQYYINFATALPNDDYAAASEAQLNENSSGFWGTVQSGVTSGTGWTTTQHKMYTRLYNSGSTTDALHITLIFCCND